jgi:hypothetical protein
MIHSILAEADQLEAAGSRGDGFEIEQVSRTQI